MRTRLDVGYSTPWCGDVVLAVAGWWQQARPGCEVSVQRRSSCTIHSVGCPRGAVDVQLTEFPIAEPAIVTGPVVFTEPRAVVAAADA
ncbi:hypothetical protein G4X40_00475 [Rhodococcus sp. D2-41]|uniref:hypothetical protein n=1 Tax=Speluncibacter jeojiensis TaxID=2710754 RepID=UPI00240F5097|nr:hypothetical protein [Rhodococcus sp. D2-41]MDG3008622.1 hypothetical protein [Rhodococcus sp. D2-41]